MSVKYHAPWRFTTNPQQIEPMEFVSLQRFPRQQRDLAASRQICRSVGGEIAISYDAMSSSHGHVIVISWCAWSDTDRCTEPCPVVVLGLQLGLSYSSCTQQSTVGSQQRQVLHYFTVIIKCRPLWRIHASRRTTTMTEQMVNHTYYYLRRP